MSEETCSNCKFSATDYGHNSRYTVCRRYPPQRANGSTEFPRVDSSPVVNWCGEWKQKETES